MNGKCKILVTGADGQLGRCMRDISVLNAQYEYIFTDVNELDITDYSKVVKMVQDERPDWIVNCAGYTAVDKAEEDQSKARLLNVDAVQNLVKAAEKIKASLIHISTDYVFPGSNPEPLLEEEPPCPLSVYGKTKHESEMIALDYPKSIVLRTSWLYSEYGNNFVKTMRKLAKDRDDVNVVGDQWGTPTSAHDLAKAIMKVISKPTYGLFHFSNEGLTSWALFTEEIFAQSGIKCQVNHISTEDYNNSVGSKTVAKRPAYSILSKKKFSKTYKVDIPEWETALEFVIQRLSESDS